MALHRNETIAELDAFWETQVRFWVHELCVTSDESKLENKNNGWT